MKRSFDLERRTTEFTIDVRSYIEKLPKQFEHLSDYKQVLRSSGSVGANYIEANEKLSKKDFLYRIKICRKEAKETIYWLNVISVDNRFHAVKEKLIDEATQLMKIFASIYRKST